MRWADPDPDRPGRSHRPSPDELPRSEEGRAAEREVPAHPRSRFEESRRLWIIGSIAVPAVLTIIGVLVTYQLAPSQEVRGEEAKQSAEAKQLAKQAPLQTRVEPAWTELDHHWYFDRPLQAADVAKLDNLASFTLDRVAAFAEPRGGIRIGNYCPNSNDCSASRSRFKLRLTGHRQLPVQIAQISAKVVAVREPPRGALVAGPVGGLGDVEKGIIMIDSPDRRLRIVDKSEKPGRLFFDERFAHLERGEPAVFEISAVSRGKDYRWELIVDAIVDGKDERVVVRADGTAKGPLFRTPGRLGTRRDYQVFGTCELDAPTCKVARLP